MIKLIETRIYDIPDTNRFLVHYFDDNINMRISTSKEDLIDLKNKIDIALKYKEDHK
jgi:hypothetical protein